MTLIPCQMNITLYNGMILSTFNSLGYGSDTMSDEHDSSQWYDIVTFSIISHGFALGFPKRYQNNGNNIH